MVGGVNDEREQELDEVHLYFIPPKWAIPRYQVEMKKSLKPGEKLPELEVKIKSDHITVGVKGNPPFLDVMRG